MTRRRAWLALLLLVPAPSIGTAIYLYGPEPTLAAKAFGFAFTKVWIALLPLAWLLWVDRQRPRVPRWSGRGMAAAHVTGAIIFLGIIAAYWLAGVQWGWIDLEVVRARAAEAGLSDKRVYLAGALYWCTLNSILEEYVWRWFVFTRCEALMPRRAAVVAAGLFFTIHHVIGISAYFDWRVTALASLGVFIGGATWSWLYLRYRNIWASYVSHVWADLAVFGVGYVLIFGS